MEQVSEDAYKRIASDAMNRERNLPGLISCDYYWLRKRREVVSMIAQHHGRFRSATKMVDLGCGYSQDIWAVSDAFGMPDLDIECVDISLSNLELAVARKAYHEVDQVRFTRHDIRTPLPWPDGSVDIIYASEIVEHIPDVETLVAECARIASAGAHLIVTTPNEPNLFQRSFYSKERRAQIAKDNEAPIRYAEDGSPIYGHISLKKNHEWDRLLLKHGFKLVDYRRGSVWFGGTRRHDTLFMLALLFGLNGFLDLFPKSWTRNVSDQLIALYERV